ncbi:MAG: beta-N-acetylhexosaminidase [Xanthobacteraceae bacterium]
MNRAFITGLAGPTLTSQERAFLREAEPWGLILFKRNIQAPDQVSRLIAEAREAVGHHIPVLVDQEGGRVQRLGPPQWPAYPPGAAYGRLYDEDRACGVSAARLGARLMAADIHRLGIDVDCLPLGDVPVAGADRVIGDRAYGETPAKVSVIAAALADGLMAGGVLPVVKHLPGHGRATADSHEKLPVVATDRGLLEATDFQAFRPLKDLPLGMTAHVVFTDLDPSAPATTSPIMIGQVIRESIGFCGVLMSDDISMGALTGTIGGRTRAAIAAGCDLVLHCNGRFEEMLAVAEESPLLDGAAARRTAAAIAARRSPSEIDEAAARAEFSALMTRAGTGARMAVS